MSGRRLALLLLVCVAAFGPASVLGYDSQAHQRLTFYAAKLLNRCLEGTAVAPLTPLQVRFVATSNMGLANSNAFVRFFRWSYFDAADRGDRQFLWLINTRFLGHFEDLVAKMGETADPSVRYQDLGRIVSYVQLVSAPSRALPVYTARFWRWSFGDRFDDYPLDGEGLQAVLDDDDCSFLEPPPVSYRTVLDDVARDTLDAVRSPIAGLPATWEAFWTPGEAPGDFGDYGAAGNNFGRAVEFRCNAAGDGDGEGNERCVLLRDDPLYAEFALQRQLAAVYGTARAMYLHQLEHGTDRVQQADR